MGNLKQAAITLENAGREVSVGKEANAKTEACRLWGEAAGFLQEAGETVRSADLRLRAAKSAEGFDNELAIRLVDEVISMFDGDTDKDVYAVEPLRKALQTQLAVGKHASAMRTMDRLFGVWTRLDQKHNLYKLIISRIVLLLAAADPVAAQQEFDRYLDLGGFAASPEAEAAEDLLSAYVNMNVDEMKAVVGRNVFGYLENHITRVARGLPDAAISGNTVGVKNSEEAASKAVTVRAFEPGQFRELGTGTLSVIGSQGSTGAQEDDADTIKARKAAQKDDDLRSSLFARPTGNVGSSSSSSSTNNNSSSSNNDNTDNNADPFANADNEGFGDGDYDYEAAFQALGANDEDNGQSNISDKNNTDPKAEIEEDLGLM